MKFEMWRIPICALYLERLRAALCYWNLRMACSLTLPFEESKQLANPGNRRKQNSAVSDAHQQERIARSILCGDIAKYGCQPDDLHTWFLESH